MPQRQKGQWTTEPVKVLAMFVNETDTWHGAPLYEAIVQRLRQLAVAGATVQGGMIGFGHHIRPGHKGLFGMSDDRPSLSPPLTKKREFGRRSRKFAEWPMRR